MNHWRWTILLTFVALALIAYYVIMLAHGCSLEQSGRRRTTWAC